MTEYTELKPLLEACRAENCDGPREFRKAVEALFDVCTVETISALIAENERLAANVKLNLCDHPAIHKGDVDLLIAFVSGASQIGLAKVHGCTPPNISRKIRRVKGRLGWREGMSVLEIRDRAEQLRSLASQGAVVTADLMAERDQLKAENETLRKAALAAREFIMHEAEVRGLLDESNEVSFRHPRRQAAIATIDAAMGKGEQS